MKLSIGNLNTLTIVKETPQGLYLSSSEGEILLPNKFIPSHYEIGQELQVFVYTDSEDRLIATTQVPKVKVEEFASLTVKQITRFGAFLDWGLDKDLLLPYKEQAGNLQEGDNVVIRACLDYKTNRVIAVARIESFLQKEVQGLQEGDAVELLVYSITPLGYKTVVNQEYVGMLYKNEVFQPVHSGASLKGYIKKIREDGKLDLTLQKQGLEARQDAKAVILEKLRESQGFLPYHDRSSPDEISHVFQMSKKNFKKALGGLYKEGIVDLQQDGIYLKS